MNYISTEYPFKNMRERERERERGGENEELRKN